jgi:hypothetical protein
MRCGGSTDVGSDSEPEENKRQHCCTWEFGSQTKLHREEARREEDAVEECRNRMNPDIIAAIPERALFPSLSLSRVRESTLPDSLFSPSPILFVLAPGGMDELVIHG